MEPINRTDKLATVLSQISLTAANIGNPAGFVPVMEDWLKFIGGRPGEIVILDGGSSPETHAIYWKLFNEKKIDKLQVIRKEHPDNHRDTCYIQEYIVGAIASKPYIFFFKSDTLPYREGHEGWLVDAIEYLEREDTFSVSGAFNIPSRHHEAWPGWYFSEKCSLNFAVMKRSSFMNAMEEFAGEFIRSGYDRSKNPIGADGNKRYVVETAFERYMAKHKKFTLVKVEDPTWTVFHTNAADKKLMEVRDNYLKRVDVDRFMNAKLHNRIWNGCYYGKPPARWANFKWTVGESPVGGVIRSIKRLIGIKSSARST